MNVINQFEWLDAKLTTTFKAVSNERYNTKFDLGNSNVGSLLPNLVLLQELCKKSKVALDYTPRLESIALNDIENMITVLKSVFDSYKKINGLPTIPSNLKWYDVRNKLKHDPVELSKMVLKEVLKPDTGTAELTHEQRIELKAKQKAEERKLKIIKDNASKQA